jgi:mRNA interferase MazF
MTALVLLRGLIVTVASPGVYSGKPRSAVVVQASRWLQGHPSVTLCPLTSTLLDAPLVRIPVEPNGTVPKAAIGSVVGQLEDSALAELDLALSSWLDLHRT